MKIRSATDDAVIRHVSKFPIFSGMTMRKITKVAKVKAVNAIATAMFFLLCGM